METTSDTYDLGQMGEKSVPLTLAMQRTFFAENHYFVLTLHASEAPKRRHQLVTRKELGGEMGLSRAMEGEQVTLSLLPSPAFAKGLDPTEGGSCATPTHRLAAPRRHSHHCQERAGCHPASPSSLPSGDNIHFTS